MKTLKVIERFTLKDYDKLKNIVRVGKDEKGVLFVGDTFECDEKMAKYLLGDNHLHKAVVKEIKVIKIMSQSVVTNEDGNIDLGEMTTASVKIADKPKTSKTKNKSSKK